MGVLLVCPCGKRWSSEDNSNAPAPICPDCGRPLIPIAAGGWQSLWPRLTIAAVATILVVVAVGIALVPFLPQRETLTDAPVAASVSQPEAEPQKPLSSGTPDKPLLRPLSPAAPVAKPILPLLDNPPSVAPLLEDPPRTPTAKPRGVKPLEDPVPKNVMDLQAKDDFFQHVVISRVSRYRILELDMGQNVQYVFVSRFHVQKKMTTAEWWWNRKSKASA